MLFISVTTSTNHNTILFISVTTSSEADAMIRALSEANMATEAGLIVLDVLSVYTDKFKVGTLIDIDTSIRKVLPQSVAVTLDVHSVQIDKLYAGTE